MTSGYFTGSLDSLVEYWQDSERAQKFRKGGTRVGAVRYLLDHAEVEIHQGLWVDTAIGAGYVQKSLYQTVHPSLMVGIDISRAMLELVDEPTERILGSSFQLPLRDGICNIATNIFSLSDYPDPSVAFDELERIVQSSGICMYLDYSDEDDYWSIRKQVHDPSTVVGNINLRNPETIQKFLPDQLRVVENVIIKYEVMAEQFDGRVELPPKLLRAFLFVQLYKPRSPD